jgi:hypothetical protein
MEEESVHQALERLEKEKLAKLEMRLSFAQNENSVLGEDDVLSDDVMGGNAASATTPLTNAEKEKEKKKRKYFTEEEDARLMEAYSVHGPNWDLIVAKAGLDRTARQANKSNCGRNRTDLSLFCRCKIDSND